VGTAVLGYLNESFEATLAGVVTVAHRTPVCTCGWIGHHRAAVFLARHDAWMHAAATGCLPGLPLVTSR
jgi:hypothetical protein